MKKDEIIVLLSELLSATKDIMRVSLNVPEKVWHESERTIFPSKQTYTNAKAACEEIEKRFLTCVACNGIINLEHGIEDVRWSGQHAYHKRCT